MYRRKKILAYKLSMLEVIVNQERNLNRTSLAKGEKKEKEKNNTSSSATTISRQLILILLLYYCY